ncbi:spore coat protein H [Entomortierella parvispora]|uniref:Spore coat protein H n=1 Tax=Entomortierella parvispora TaxID=205924 RepID=A0A9P3LYR2_9FUNG|nr:spore coat protein H [Entomortierella parvispora]
MKFVCILALAAVAQAAQITFRVVAPGATSVSVLVNGQQTALSAADPTVPYFTGVAETGSDSKYKYQAGGVAETFDRPLPAGRTSTLNDFINRPVTYADIPELPWPIEKDPQWTRSGPKQPLFDTNYIPTIFVNGDVSQLDALIANPVKTKYPVTLTYILADETKTFTNVSFGIHGAGKKKNNSKQSWNWQLNAGDTYQERSFFKIRHQEEDPTQIREKLYADISRAMGTYANEAVMVRLFINGDGFGTFNLLDDVTQYSYPSAMFYAGKPPAQMGGLFDGASGASFQYSATGDYYSWIQNPASPDEPSAIGPFCELWSKTDKTNDAAIATVNQQLDLDSFVRFMVLEYLTGNWDGYWEGQTNDGLYRDTTQNNKWYYLAQDFDATFGVNLPSEDPTFVTWSYTKFPAAYPGAVLINGLLQNPTYQKTFESYLKNTVQVLFNNVTLSNRILKYHEFILPDLAWDRNITQRSPGIDFHWTLAQATANLYEGVVAGGTAPGGAGFGLLEWISKKADAVAKEFSITITSTPVGPPSVANGNKPSASATGPTTPTATGPGSGGRGDTVANAAVLLSPGALTSIVLVGASIGVSLMM